MLVYNFDLISSQRFRSSSVPREQAVFSCMVQNLFDEYKYFPRYPEKVRTR